jgi:hypothetical protein
VRSFATYPGSLEIDVRSSYCAFVLQHFLSEPIFDRRKAIDFVLSCEVLTTTTNVRILTYLSQRYDGSFAQAPGLEGNGQICSPVLQHADI